eukprot:6208865-Pleurochrysis_carterae.AAC.2
MRFLVHASGDHIFGLSLRGGDPAFRHAPLPSVARAALFDALAFPLQALDACAAPFLVATTHWAAMAVAPVAASTGVSSASKAMIKGGTALWETLAILAGTPYYLPASLAASKLRSYIAPGVHSLVP